MKQAAHDLIVIGTGTAATAIALGCRKAGWSVAIIDHLPFGGTCALCGCDPKKVIIAATEVIDDFERMGAIGTVRGEVRIDWAALQRHKRSFTDPVPEEREQVYAKRGIDTYHGRARFGGANSVVVGDTTLVAPRVVIATDAERVQLPIEGTEHLTFSDEFLSLESLPACIVLVGGGYIGFEFSHIAARAGTKVTILNRSARPLAGFDPDLVNLLVKRTRALGVDVRLGHEVKAVRERGAGFDVEAQTVSGHVTVAADMVIHSGGRAPALYALDLDAAGIAHEHGNLNLDEYLRSTTNPAVYAAGDAAGRPLPLTRVGLLEAEAKAQGLRFKVSHASVPGWFTARRVNESCYGYKVLVEEGSERILGACLHRTLVSSPVRDHKRRIIFVGWTTSASVRDRVLVCASAIDYSKSAPAESSGRGLIGWLFIGSRQRGHDGWSGIPEWRRCPPRPRRSGAAGGGTSLLHWHRSGGAPDPRGCYSFTAAPVPRPPRTRRCPSSDSHGATTCIDSLRVQ